LCETNLFDLNLTNIISLISFAVEYAEKSSDT